MNIDGINTGYVLDHIKEIVKKLQDDCNALAYQSAGEAKHA